MIGTYRTFTSPKVSSDSSGKDQTQLHGRSSSETMDTSKDLSTGQISLSPLLANAFSTGTLPDSSLAPADVVPLLTNNLQWRITTKDSSSGEQKEVPVQDLADKGQLRIAVVSRDVDPILAGEEHLFPKYHEWTEWEDVTKGKTGGV